MLPTRPLRSATFRLTIAYLAVFSISAAALLSLVYFFGAAFMQRQTVETIEIEINGLEEQYRDRGLSGLIQTIRQRSNAEHDFDSVYLLTDIRGRPLAGNLQQWPTNVEETEDGARFQSIIEHHTGRTEARQVLAKYFIIENRARLLVGRDIEDKSHTLAMLRRVSLAGLGIMVILGLGAGFVMSRWTLGRLESVNRTTTRIIEGDLSRRINLHGSGDEFDELAGNINAMLERIERLLAGMRQVTDNIAHDLRTPLNRLRSRAEVAALGKLDETTARETLEATVADADSLIATFNALLDITRAEAGETRSAWEPIDLKEVMEDVYELYEPVAEEKNISFESPSYPEKSVMVSGNRQLLAQAIANLVDNAIKYTPVDGKVSAALNINPRASLTISDNGPGIPGEFREKVLDRFYRLEADRSTAGNGLGLSMVNAVCKLHDAQLSLGDNQPGLIVSIAFAKAKPAKSIANGK